MSIREGARRHPVLSAVGVAYIVAWTIYGVVVGAKLAAPYVVIVACVGLAIAAADARVEFGASHLLAATNVGGYENTGRDLVANLIGTAFAGWLVSRRPV